ncbi:VCBS domain-containing protein, partial [Mesorhizobium abyssinicae]
MATQVTGAGGTTTSFSNTPQAKDDTFLYSEDAGGVLILNVLANDLGGAAKTLYSIDDTVSASTATKTYAPADLLTKDITYSSSNDSAGAAGTTDTSQLGAKIWIASDGTIHYSTASIDGLLQSLAAGQVLIDKVTYAIQLGNGTLSWATATIQFTGTNDKPDIHLVAGDSAAASLNETNSPLTASGTLTVNDADLSDTVSASVTSVSLGGTTGGLNSAAVINMLTVSPASLSADAGETHNLTWTFNSTPQAFDFLAAGETLTLSYTIKADDGHVGGTDTQTVTITINGTNDAPDISVGSGDSAAAGLNETNAPLTANGTLTVTDADLSDTVTPSVTMVSPVGPTGGLSNATLLGMLTVAPGSLAANPTDSHNLGWTFNSTPQAFDFLAAGETLTLTYTIKADDGHVGGTDTQTVTITITGANDAAVITGDDTGSVIEASGVANGTPGTSPATGDLDATDVDSLNAFSVLTNGVHGTLSINAAGEWSYVLNEDDAAVQALNTGDPALTDTITVQTSDGTTKDIVISINGANDAAVITGDDTGSVIEASGVA